MEILREIWFAVQSSNGTDFFGVEETNSLKTTSAVK